MFASVFVPDFSLQALFAARKELRNQAVAVVDGQAPLIRVIAVNGKASQAGVEPGLLKAQAEMAGINVVSRSEELERAAHQSLLDCAHDISPRVQDRGVDLVIAYIAGLQRLFGPPKQIADRIRNSMLERGISVTVGVAENPDTATIAARGFGGVAVITDAKQIRRLPVTLLNLSPEFLETLELWGINTLGQLADLDGVALSQRLGQEGVTAHKLARGQQVNPFIADEKELEFHERTDLEYAIDLLDPLSFVISSLVEKICAQLREHALATNELDCELALDPPRVAGEHMTDEQLFYRKTVRLPSPTTDQKFLLRLLQLELQSPSPNAPVTSVSIRANAVKPRYVQQGLFAPQTPDPDRLELTIARLSNLVGKDQIGSPEILDSNRPRGFVMGKFAPARDEKKSPRTLLPKMALRLFEPPKRARIRLRSDVPIQVSFDGKTGAVINHTAPWLSSGEWWNDIGWNRKEWDVELRFETGATANYRIFVDLFTNTPFVEGTYD
jgi:protein ImuB